MNWKNRLTNYNFWISLVSAVLLIMQAFNFEFDIANLSEIVTALLGFLVVIGIISNPTKSKKENMAEQSNSQSSKVEQPPVDSTPAKDQNESKENEDSMPCNKQDEDNIGIGEDDFKVLIDKISSDIAMQTGIVKENVENVVNEIIKTYEEGESIMENQIDELKIEDGEIETEIIEEKPDVDVEVIAEELLETDEFEIENEYAEVVEQEYIEYKNEISQEDQLQKESAELKEDEVVVEEITLSQEIANEEASVEEIASVEGSVEEIENPTQNDQIQENPEENIISFKIVN